MIAVYIPHHSGLFNVNISCCPSGYNIVDSHFFANGLACSVKRASYFEEPDVDLIWVRE